MTREEAIKWIDDRMCFGRGTFTEHHPPNIDECWQAGMMAIDALSDHSGEVTEMVKKDLTSDGDLIYRAEAEWIPCSERLPKEKDAGILKKLGINKRSDYVIATVEVNSERMTVIACTYDGKWNWDKKYAFPDFKVVAWMPQPEPYREDGEI